MWVGAPRILADKRLQAALAASIMVVAVVRSSFAAMSLGSGKPSVPLHPFNVTFSETALDYGYCSGWSRYGSSGFPRNLTIEFENLTWFYFSFVWSDDVGSPFVDPTVGLTFAAPNGTVIYNGPAPTTRTTWNISLNEIPPDTEVMAESPEAAVETAFVQGGANHTLGMGNWSYTLDVGEIPYARNQIRSGINYQCWFGFGTIEAAAANATVPG